MCVPSACAEDLVVQGGAGPKRDSSGSQLCEHCQQRLNRVKGKPYSCPPGLMCHKCYNKEQSSDSAASKRSRTASTDAAAPSPKRVRRTQSEPGEPVNLARTRTRAEPPTTVLPARKTCPRAPTVDPSLLLDETHAQRLVLLAAVAADAAHCVIPNASAVVSDT